MARPVSITSNGAQKDTARSRFGTASLLGSSGSLTINDDSFHLKHTDEFTMEMWVYNTDTSKFVYLYSSNFYNTPNAYFALVLSNGKLEVQYSSDGNNFLNFIGTSNFPANSWTHVALTGDGAGNWKIWLNGNLDATGSVTIASGVVGSPRINEPNLTGWIDEFRVSSVQRYTSNFSVPTSAFTNDFDTLLLLHMDGADGSTTFTDDNSSPLPTPTNLNVTNITATGARLNWSPGQ